MDERQAFDEMRVFLVGYLERTKGMAEVRLVFSNMELEPNGSTSDPATWGDWTGAVQEVLGARG